MDGRSSATRPRRAGGRAARRRRRAEGAREPILSAPPLGGSYRPLSDHDLGRIHDAAFDVLERIGMADATPELLEIALEKGCRLNRHGRLCLPRPLVEDVVDTARKEFVLHGRAPAGRRDVEISGRKVHYGTGGMAVRMLDIESGRYRPSTLRDLYDCARLVDTLDNIKVFGRTVVPSDLDDLLEFDLNIAYVLLAGTTKPLGIGFSDSAHVAPAVEMLDAVLGGEGRFRRRPITTCNCCAIVPPLKFGADNTAVAMAAARHGFPIKIITAAQAGATAPAALAGTLVQTVAETLAGLAMVNFTVPGHPVLFGNWPFVSDLRTGAFSGGGGEEAILSAAAVQSAKAFGLPTCVGAGMTDAKEPDAQAGYEKGIANVLAGLAGANLIDESAGMMASLLGCSFESFIIDDDMLGIASRAIRGIEVTDESLSVAVIEEVVLGAGHYLGHPQTLALMESEYVYPKLADRSTADEWEATGAVPLREKARQVARRILAEHYPQYIDARLDARLRDRFPIKLALERMRAKA